MKGNRRMKPHMSSESFGELSVSLNEALEHARGERADLRVTTVPFPAAPKPLTPARVVTIRKKMKFSQSMFAKLLNVSSRTVQDWEQGRRQPSDAALKLLVIAEKHPEVLLEG